MRFSVRHQTVKNLHYTPMRRIFLLVGFIAHVTLGSMCFSQLAFARLASDGTPAESVVPMSYRFATSCSAVKVLRTEANAAHKEQRGCPDGRCFQAPELDVNGTSTLVVDEGVGFHLQIGLTELSKEEVSCDDLVSTDDPLKPPGVESVVLRN